MEVFLGIDVGSVTTKIAAVDREGQLTASLYRRTEGRPIEVVQESLRQIQAILPTDVDVAGVGTTGSGRQLAAVVVGADLVKNEITAHAVAALHFVPDVHTVMDIGGQDSKLIILEDGIVVDFAMNSVCAAGTGSFLEQQAHRLNISIEELGRRAMRSRHPVRIAGRCTVFAESDMIHKQQMGHPVDDILYGLCQALVRNYLNNLALGKTLRPPVVFQGGVAANAGVVRAFAEALETEVIVPPQHEVMGALGAALLVRERMNGQPTRFRGFGAAEIEYRTSSFECRACPNRCEIAEIRVGREVVARWGGRCDRWEMA
ncbi:MAG: 2-hydroxyglutaryl-CoA dehydratase [Chloroflexota bacterium]|nr:MAG: 2-hydroxyglutaryl-CoA dehydratase [Chloroflexota bacterium]